MEIQKQLLEASRKISELCEQYITQQFAEVFAKYPDLHYIHYAKYAKKRYISLNGIRWEDIDYHIQALEFESMSRWPEAAQQVVKKTIDNMPPYKILRLAADDVYKTIALLTSLGIFKHTPEPFKLLATRDSAFLKPLSPEESEFYPPGIQEGA